jgi:cell division protein FtsB
MKSIKKALLRALFMVQVVVVIHIFINGKHGWHYITAYQQENKMLAEQVQELKAAVGSLEHQLSTWQNNSYYLEKYAREQLHMAHPSEYIFYLPKS